MACPGKFKWRLSGVDRGADTGEDLTRARIHSPVSRVSLTLETQPWPLERLLAVSGGKLYHVSVRGSNGEGTFWPNEVQGGVMHVVLP
jgi:hypothetical protein